MDALLVLLNVAILVVELTQLIRDALKDRRSLKGPPNAKP